jgi:signal transduction histidine kinase
MRYTRQPGRRILAVLIGGFGLLMVLLVGSALVALQAVEQLGEANARLVEEHRISSRLIDEAQRHEAGLSSIFYAVAQGAGPTERGRLLERLSALSAEFEDTTAAGMRTSEHENWKRVQQASAMYVDEVREVLTRNLPPAARFYKQHEQLLDVMNQLVASNYQVQALTEKQQTDRSHDRVRQLLVMVGLAVLIALVVAIVAVRSVQAIFQRLQWQASELARLSARMLETQEETARRFSRELHDEFGQTLSALEANLVALRNSRWNSDRLEDAVALVKEAIGNAREMSQLLRPSILDDFGLDPSLRWYVERYSQRTGVKVQFESNFSARLKDEVETHLFRIAQESLTNVSRHSNATRVRIDLASDGNHIRLTLSDNGQGFDGIEPRGGLGLPGMRTRAQSVGGKLSVVGKPGQGVTIKVEVPLELAAHAAEDAYSVS